MPTNLLAFRVWDCRENEGTGAYIDPSPKGDRSWYMLGSNGRLHECDHGFITILPDELFIVERFTGLTDKNGKPIYEGDILKSTWIEGLNAPFTGKGTPKTGYSPVRWEGLTCIVAFHPGAFIPPQDSCGRYDWQNEVVGNVHENPELLTTT